MSVGNQNENWHARLAHLESLATSQVGTHQGYSVQFAVVLVANLMLINSGALFAFPSFVEKIASVGVDAGSISKAAWSYVLGIVLATSCGYCAYHNFMALAEHSALVAQETLFDHKFPEADKSHKEIVDWFDSNSREIKKLSTRINVTLWVGNLTGIASLVCFVTGCFFVRLALLS